MKLKDKCKQNKSMNLFIISVSMVFMSFMTGCGGKAPSPVEKVVPTPEWVNSVLPNDTQTKMFGMAVEKDRDSAIKAALTDMVSRLGTTIESSFESNQKVENSYSTLSVKSNIKADISKIKINNYRVVKSFKINYNEFAVMIETDKQKFIDGLKSNLEVEKQDIQQKFEALKNQDSLNRYNVKQELSQRANNLVPTILMLSQLDKSFSQQLNLNYVSSKKQEFLMESNKLKFYVSGDEKSSIFVKKIKDYLAQNSFNISNSKENAIHIKLSTTDNITNQSISIAVLTLNIGVFDNGNSIGGKSLILKERYNSSLSSVYKNASIHLEEDIRSQGLNEVIGIKLNINI